MNKLPILTAVLAILVAPAVLAGTPAAPEVVDGSGETSNAALDISAGWFTTGGLAHPLTPSKTDRVVTFTWKLADLGLAAPAADATTEDIRYHYDLSFKSSSYPNPVLVRCYIQLVDSSAVITDIQSSPFSVGTACIDARDGAAIILEANPDVNVEADTFTVSLETPFNGGVGLPPGTVLSAISLKTAGGPAATTLSPLLAGSNQGPVQDTAAGIKNFVV